MIYISVAGFTVGISSFREEALRKRMARNYAPFLIEDSNNPLFIIDADQTVSLPAATPVHVFDYALTEDTARLTIYNDCRILSISTASGHTFSIRCIPARDGEIPVYISDLASKQVPPPGNILDHLLLFALSMAGLKHGLLIIHSSTTMFNGCSMMFLGESGTGKSTHSRMWLENITGATLLNDDATALRLLPDGTAMTYGTPWSGKTPCYRNDACPLKAFVRIRRAPYNRLSRQNTIHSFGAVLPSCLPTLQQDETTLDTLCDLLSHILSTVPVYIMECLPDGNAAHVCREGIFGTDNQ